MFNLTQHEYILAYERTLLSSIIFQNELLSIFLKNSLVISDFSHKVHRDIFNSMLDLMEKSYDINELNLLNENREYEHDLIEIMSTTPVSNPIVYIDLLKDYKLKNQTINIAKQIAFPKDDSVTGKELYSKLLELTSSNDLYSNSFNVKPLDDVKDEKIEILCKNYVPLVKRTINLFTAKGDTGKTFLLIAIALHYQLDQIKNKSYKKCFCWFTEDDLSIIKSRKNQLIDELFENVDDRELLKDPKYKHLLQISDALPFYFIYQNNKNTFSIDDNFLILKHQLRDFELVIFDPLASFIGINENDNAIGKAFMNLLVHWAREEDKAVALIHHTPGKEKKARGAEAIRDSSKMHYFVEKIIDKEGKIVESAKQKLDIVVDKDNYGVYAHQSKKSKRVKVFPKQQGRLL